MYPAIEFQRRVVRRLNGRCEFSLDGGVLSYLGEKHRDCSTCDAARCGGADLGLANTGLRIARVFGVDAMEMVWACPQCGGEVTQTTSPLGVLAEAKGVTDDPLCYRCRK
jgi:hypothetical protein